MMITSDGKNIELPEPYKNGYTQFSYKVLETTNCNGIEFPLNAVLYQFAPLPNGKSRDDLFTGGITKLSVQQIDVGGRSLALMPVPKLVVALDERFGLSNNLTINYFATNDQYYALNNTNLERLANYYRRYVH